MKKWNLFWERRIMSMEAMTTEKECQSLLLEWKKWRYDDIVKDIREVLLFSYGFWLSMFHIMYSWEFLAFWLLQLTTSGRIRYKQNILPFCTPRSTLRCCIIPCWLRSKSEGLESYYYRKALWFWLAIFSSVDSVSSFEIQGKPII